MLAFSLSSSIYVSALVFERNVSAFYFIFLNWAVSTQVFKRSYAYVGKRIEKKFVLQLLLLLLFCTFVKSGSIYHLYSVAYNWIPMFWLMDLDTYIVNEVYKCIMLCLYWCEVQLRFWSCPCWHWVTVFFYLDGCVRNNTKTTVLPPFPSVSALTQRTSRW